MSVDRTAAYQKAKVGLPSALRHIMARKICIIDYPREPALAGFDGRAARRC